MLYRIVHTPLGNLVKEYEERTRPPRPDATDREIPGHTLYHFYVSPYAMRVRKALHQLGLSVPMKDVLSDSDALAELIKHGGKDQVPCLRIETKDGVKWMYESLQIVAYLKGLR